MPEQERKTYKNEGKEMKKLYGLDIETYDPLLTTAGSSWKYGKGYILCTALYNESADKLAVIAGDHNDASGQPKEERNEGNALIELLLKCPDACIVGANILYDIGWLIYEYGMSVYDIKCSFVDVLQAEHLLDEFGNHSLESVSRKYLGYGKSKDLAEEYVREHISKTGDFRRYLKDVPYEILETYVKGDAKNPVKVWRKQLTLLKEQDLCKRAKLEFDCILPTLAMTVNGIPFDLEQKNKNLSLLTEAIDLLQEDFVSRYNLPKFRITATRDIASFCDMRGIPYKNKITLTGYDGKKFADGNETDEAYRRAKRIVSQFRLKKGKPVAYVPHEIAERTEILLKNEGFMFNSSPNMDKGYFASQRDNYPEIALIADWKSAVGIKSKILGEEYNRFVGVNSRNETCLKPEFNITSTVSFRYSSKNSNCQQIPSKGGLEFTTDKGREISLSFPKLTRALFKASLGCVFGKIDYGQIEYRLICNIACGEAGEKVRAEYAKNPKLDFHQYVVDLTGLSRKYAKNMSFGVSFGMGLPSMAESFGWSMEKAEEIASAYHEHMPFVQPTLELVGDVAKQRGYIKTVCGSHARLHDPKKSYTMLNRYTQGSGAECLKSSIIRAYREGLWERLKPANTIHDELSFPYLEPTIECMKDFMYMAEIMRTSVPSLRVPLEAEIELGDNWASTKTVPEWEEAMRNRSTDWQESSKELKRAVLICLELNKEIKENDN